MFTLNMFNAFYRRALSLNILVYILLFSLNLHFIPEFFFFKLRHGIFCIFFSHKMHCFEWRRHKETNNYVLGYKMASMVILVFSMVKCSILEVGFILISRGKKLN